MNKQQRIILFHEAMASAPLAASPQDAWTVMASVLAAVEANHVPAGEAPMTIHPLTHADVRPYGNGGHAIPLIGYVVFLNANGAIGIRNDWAGGVLSLTRPGADGVPFAPVPGWRYPF